MANPRINEGFWCQSEIDIERAALAENPPTECPCCKGTATSHSKDEYGRWTWNCKEGCNP